MIIYGFVRYRYHRNCLLLLSRVNSSIMLLIPSVVSFYLAFDQKDSKKDLPVVSEIV